MNSIAVEHSIMSCSEAIHVGWFPGNQFVQATKVTQNKKSVKGRGRKLEMVNQAMSCEHVHDAD